MYIHLKYVANISSIKIYYHDIATVLTWLNATAAINHVLKFDVATIQGWLLFEGGLITFKHLDSLLFLFLIK